MNEVPTVGRVGVWEVGGGLFGRGERGGGERGDWGCLEGGLEGGSGVLGEVGGGGILFYHL
jgi:hypothetical protein